MILVGETATIRPVCQAGAEENKALNVCVARGVGEMFCSLLIDRVRLFRRRTSEECSTVNDRGDACDGGNQGLMVQEVAVYKLYLAA